MTINVGLLILLMGSLVATLLTYNAFNDRINEVARALSGIFAFLTAIGCMIVASWCFIDKTTIDTSDLIQFHHCSSIAEKYDNLTN